MHGADVSAQTPMGGTALHIASANFTRSRTRMVLALLRHGAHIHARDIHRATALHAAIGIHSVQGIKLLLGNGATLSDRNFCWFQRVTLGDQDT